MSLKLKSLLITTGILLSLGLLATGLGWWYVSSLIERTQTPAKKTVIRSAAPSLGTAPSPIGAPEIELEAAGQTWLLMGSDSRGSEKWGRSDTMLLVRVEPKKGWISILPLPRDLQVTTSSGVIKLNAAYATKGPGGAIEAVRDAFGIRINHFAVVDFSGFQEITDLVGGVWLPIDGRYYNRNQGTAATNYAEIDLHAGYQYLNGKQALSWVRYRHTDTDFHRSARQTIFLRSFKNQLESHINSPTKIDKVLKVTANNMTSDVTSVPEVIDLFRLVSNLSSDEIYRFRLQGSSSTSSGAYYFISNQQQRATAIRQWSNPLSSAEPVISAPKKLQQSASSISLVTDSALVDDFKTLRSWKVKPCTPQKLLPGMIWDPIEPFRAYQIGNKKAVAAVGYKENGSRVLFMQTEWATPAWLAEPAEEVVFLGREYRVYQSGGKTTFVAWRLGKGWSWVQNTLLTELNQQQLLMLANGCR